MGLPIRLLPNTRPYATEIPLEKCFFPFAETFLNVTTADIM